MSVIVYVCVCVCLDVIKNFLLIRTRTHSRGLVFRFHDIFSTLAKPYSYTHAHTYIIV